MLVLCTVFLLACVHIQGGAATTPYAIASTLGVKVDKEMRKLISLNISEFCEYFDYPFETYNVKTDDGYILEMHRIPHGVKNKDKDSKGVVFIQHGIFSSSFDWVITKPDRSLAFALADQGYDVFLGNFRGNDFSQKHKTLEVDSSEFWKFSWHEMGIYDLSAMINKALKIADAKKLHYIGHSQGTTAFWVMTSLKPSFNKKIKTMYALAPVAYMRNTKSAALRAFGLCPKLFGAVSSTFGWKKFSTKDGFFKHTNELFCKGDLGAELCSNVLFSIVGFNRKNLDDELLPLYMAHSPSTSGLGQILHYAQVMETNRFCEFDYGTIQNVQLYSNTKPPLYPLDKITANIVFIYSKNDLICAEADVGKLAEQIKNIRIKTVKDPKFSHIDYLFGKNAKEMVYDRIIKDMEKYEE